MSPLLVDLAAEIIRWGLVLILTVAAVKLRRRSARADLASMLSAGLLVPGAGLVAFGLPILEGLVAMLLVLSPHTGAAAGVLLLSVLTVGVAGLSARRTEFRCACFGGAARPITGRTVVRNGLLTSSALMLLVVHSDHRSAAIELAVWLTLALVAVLVAARRQVQFILRGPARPSIPPSLGRPA